MNTNVCRLGENAVVDWYQSLVRDEVLFADEIQAAAVAKLQKVAGDCATPLPRINFIKRLFTSPPECKRGLYLHGGVGRGKTFLMDGFYLQLKTEKKIRVHFHQFMRHLHDDMKKRSGENDPLLSVADSIAQKNQVICFDEFHVSDIADAMILGRLLERLFANGIYLVMTSNYSPDGLYPNGLARERFLPAIDMLKTKLEVFSLDGDEDYRLRHLSKSGGVFFDSQDGEGVADMQRIFGKLACGIQLLPAVRVNGRVLPALARTSDAIWFSFGQLCIDALGQSDYLVLAERYATILVSDVPRLDDAEQASATRRFTWLVDILYDQGVTLVLSAVDTLHNLYGDCGGGESGRTLSRLIEMQSPDYWKAPTKKNLCSLPRTKPR
ncbi:cell division protein ZapE [Candidatus Persebacteraceae bacterium Df01]|jgi:cell division protein ZapE|uniref:Cell division protein ZapE n=1 Tax=Candidatus Doriopsillibacter californiensis TaxID=2970740 RepID=A0ABT7QKI2_9GAMM|nr:cell division protein ZapE [Candidatus Persebacteraceae bacterium Df01]